MKNIIVIIGPTGVGKTKLSIELAKKMDAEIINGDSVSIYRDLNIGSAKPLEEERCGIVHHLIDICDINDSYSVYNYQQDVRKLITDITNRGKRVIIVGGTGLYIKASLYDYIFAQENSQKSYSDLSNLEITKKIEEYGYSDIPHINNRKRLVRLLNKLENNEEITHSKDKLLYPVLTIGLTTERDNLYKIIDKRVDKMIENGLVDEVSNLKNNFSTSRVLNTAIGYQEFYDYFYGDKKLDEVISEIKSNSRHYAKRQYTFFKHQFDTKWFDVNFDNFNRTVEEVNDYIKKEEN